MKNLKLHKQFRVQVPDLLLRVKAALLIPAIAMLLSPSASAYDFEHDGIAYNILSEDEQTVEVTFFGEFIGDSHAIQFEPYTYPSEPITIPETVEQNGKTYSVTAIGYCAFICKAKDIPIFGSSPTSISIPNSIKEIGDSAFMDCYNLTSIIIPNSVTKIGNYTFSDCDKLASVTLPQGIDQIENNMFTGCSSLESVDIPETVARIGSGAFSG